MTLRRTKIVATIGPATNSERTIEALIVAGANVMRLNFSHGNAADHKNTATIIRNTAERLGKHVGILADLQGPKIRIAQFKKGPVALTEGELFTIDTQLDDNSGDERQVGCAYKTLHHDCQPGSVLLLNDGRIQLTVVDVMGSRIKTEVLVGGELSDRKGINLKGGGLSAPALTDKDKQDILTVAEIKADYVAVSFVKSAADIHEARALLADAGCHAGMVAKIERAEVVNDASVLDEVILASDAIMVARGDLGVEVGDAELIGVQKYIIQRCRELDRVVITATQMMESMIDQPIPTRAEVFDVANAVLDGTDAVMLSAETATGKHPVKVVESMSNVCQGAERDPSTQKSGHRVECEFTRTDESIAMATMYIANHLRGVSAIICLTESGSTPLWMSRIRSGIPIYGITNKLETLRKMTLYRGVYPISFDVSPIPRPELNVRVIEALQAKNIVSDGDLVIVTKGGHIGVEGTTNTLKIMRVGAIT